MLLVNALLLLLGCLLKTNAFLLVIAPILLPNALALGADSVQFGVIVVVKTMICLATPPYGLLRFVVTSIARTPVGQTIRHLLPFLASLIAGLSTVIFPDAVLWLPGAVGDRG